MKYLQRVLPNYYVFVVVVVICLRDSKCVLAYHYSQGSLCSTDKSDGSCNTLVIPDNSLCDNTHLLKLNVSGADGANHSKHNIFHSLDYNLLMAGVSEQTTTGKKSFKKTCVDLKV
ncbi:hypothetical protein BsWGS_12539 [Bradybaena similaris]